MMPEIDLLATLSDAFGPSGSEENVREILKKRLGRVADRTRVDNLGNIMFYHEGKKSYPRIMLSAHMDEVGFLVTYVEKEGFLRFERVGGITDNIMLGQRLLIRGSKGFLRGIIGAKPPHILTAEEQNKIIPIEDLFIDIGTDSQDSANKKGIDVGTLGVFDVNFTELGEGFVLGKAFDDRAGCTVLAEVFDALSDSPYNIVAVGSVQEELGLRGARTAAWQIDPDFGLALEGTFAADVPGTRPDRSSARLKGGPVVTIMDRTVFTDRRILETLISAGRKKSIPFQFKKVPTGGTDAGAINLTKAGVPSGTVAVPCRYIHGPAAITHVEDIRHTAVLTIQFIKDISTSQRNGRQR